jgi:hypothetical protein
MTDRELLELAAKAAGEYHGTWSNKENAFIEPYGGDFIEWNPLDDDGDALRLAVKLKMVIDTDWNGGANAGNAAIDFAEPEYGYQEAQGKNDPYAATRRAIVRAAAEIGKGMK